MDSSRDSIEFFLWALFVAVLQSLHKAGSTNTGSKFFQSAFYFEPRIYRDQKESCIAQLIAV